MHVVTLTGLWMGIAGWCLSCSEAKAPSHGRIASASPTDSSSADSAPITSASASAPSPSAGPPSPFYVVLDKGTVQLFPAAGATLVLGPGLGTLEPDGTFRFDPVFMTGLEPRAAGMATEVQVAGGRWPSLLFAAITVPVGRTGQSEISQWKSTQWVKVGTTNPGQGLMAVFPYVDGSVLFVENEYLAPGYSLRVSGGSGKVKAPKPSPPPKTDWFPAQSRLHPASIDVLETGQIFAVGNDLSLGESAGSTFSVERLSPGGAAVVDLLPTSKKGEIPDVGESSRVVAAAANDVWVSTRWQKKSAKNTLVVTSAYLAHFDGASWTEVASPSKQDDFQLSGRDAKGTIWATAGGKEVWKHTSGGSWIMVPLPSSWPRPDAEPRIDALTVTQDGDALVAVTLTGPNDAKGHATSLGTMLLSTRKPARVVEVPSSDAYRASVRKVSLPRPPTPDCAYPFVLLYTLSKVAPADFDYPATRKALTGHTEFAGVSFLEFTRDGQRFMGAKFPGGGWDWDLPKKMVALVKKGVVGSNPQMVCHDPEGSRVLKIDLKTGALVP